MTWIAGGLLSRLTTARACAQLSHAPWHTESRPTGERRRLTDVRLLAPVAPSKIVAVGRNYADHASELGSPTTEEPRVFFKPPTAVIGLFEVGRGWVIACDCV